MITTAPTAFTDTLNALAEGARDALRAKGHRFSSTDGVRVAFCNKYGVENGILGSFSWQAPDTIVLAPPPHETLSEFWAQEMCSTYIHELHHRWQFQRWGLAKYALRAVPFLRHWTLESSAKAIELEADRLLGTEKE
jgi:hypothetical protein